MDEGSKSGGGLAQPRVHPPSAHHECQRWPSPHQIRKVVCFLFSPSFLPFLLTHVFFFCIRFERFFGGGAYAHLCVTQKMKDMLSSEWGFPEERITVLYDRPPSKFFKPLSPEEKRLFLEYFTASMLALSSHFSPFLSQSHSFSI